MFVLLAATVPLLALLAWELRLNATDAESDALAAARRFAHGAAQTIDEQMIDAAAMLAALVQRVDEYGGPKLDCDRYVPYPDRFHRHYLDLVVFDARGVPICYARDEHRRGAALGWEGMTGWSQRAVLASPPFWSPALGEWTMLMVQALPSGQGSVALALDLAKLAATLDRLGFRDQDEAVLANADGIVLAHTADSRWQLGERLPAASAAADGDPADVVDFGRVGQASFQYVTHTFGPSGWRIAVRTAPPGTATAWRVALMAGLTLGLACVLLGYVVPRLVRPVEALRHEHRESHAVLETIFKRVPVGLSFIDNELRLRRMNDALAAIDGVPAHTQIGKPMREVAPHVADTLEPILRKVLDTGQPERDVLLSANRTGEPGATRHWRTSYYAVDAVDGTRLGVGAVVVEETEAILHRREQARLEARLQEARKTEALGRLAGGVAHDFNNMLSVIFGHADVALDRLSPDHPARKQLLEVLAASHRASDYVQQLLSFARDEFMPAGYCEIDATVARERAMLQGLLGRTIALDLQLSSETNWVAVPPAEAMQLLTNLVTNARDAIAGAGTVTISTTCVERDAFAWPSVHPQRHARYVRVEVLDTGCGMTPETLERIYEPYFTTKPHGEGTGLGLAIVRGIVERHHGCIEVTSAIERGTQVRIHLPLREALVTPVSTTARHPGSSVADW